jgi:hypothetical protein
MKWGWLFRTYVQWHAIAFLLSELCVRTKGEAVERAWRALEATAGRWWYPLGESFYRKGKQGCLWKPLRKLMAKARAARERELKLEQASQALKNGSVAYKDFPHLPNPLPEPLPADQPSPEVLDKMLRPEAPRLGEMPIAQAPTWSESPPMGDSPTPIYGNLSSLNRSTIGGGLDSVSIHDKMMNQEKPMDQAQYFSDLSEHGLDVLVGDVMDGMGYEDEMHPSDGSNFNNLSNVDLPPFPTSNVHVQSHLEHLQSNGVVPGFMQPSGLFPSAEFGDSPAAAGESSGQSETSPDLDGQNMDWALWDDMLSQYGMGAQAGVSSNPVGHLGMVNWF